MIDAERNLAGFHVTPEQTGCLQEIENDAPAGDLGMVVAAAVIVPNVAVLVRDCRFGDRPNQYVCAVDGHDSLAVSAA
jgi:hypothetical protein